MKRLLKIIFVIPFVMILTMIKVNASGDYEINKLKINVDLQQNGDAHVKEIWDVKYNYGDFTRFYKEIYKNVTRVEEFDRIEPVGATIDNEFAEASFVCSERINKTFCFDDESDVYRINFFKKINGSDTGLYEIDYIIKNVVKETDNNKALFVYRYVGKNFEDNIKNVEIKVNFPFLEDFNLEYNNKNVEYIKEPGNITFRTKDHYGLLKISVSLNSDKFENLQYISLDDIENTYKEKMDIPFVFYLFIGYFGFIITIIIFGIIEKIKVDKIIKENPNAMDEYINKYESLNVHPIALLRDYYSRFNPFEFIIIEFLDLYRRGKCRIDDENIYIDGSIDGLDKTVIDIIFKYFNSNNDKYVINIKEFNDFISSTDKETVKSTSSMYSDIKSIKIDKIPDLKIKSLEINVVSTAYQKHPEFVNISSYDLLKKAANNETISYKTILSLVYSDYALDEDSSNSSIPLCCFCYNIDRLSTESRKSGSSSSGCSSCSSCSSCGGCGGGGAD